MITFRQCHTVEDYLSSDTLLFDDIYEAFEDYQNNVAFKRITYDDVIEEVRRSDVGSFFDFARFDNSRNEGFRPELRSKAIRWIGRTVDYFDGVVILHDFGRDYTCRNKDHLVSILIKQYSYKTIPQLINVLKEMMPIIMQMSKHFEDDLLLREEWFSEYHTF